MASKAKKRRRRVLGASCILAALIVAGSSFAWFTSKDEVVNRLSANAEYEMAIAETFQPPETWVPGQTIGKDVAVVNTGNVDAFTRVWLEGEMHILSQYKGGSGTPAANNNAKYDTTNSFDSIVTGLSNVNDEALLNMGITKFKENGDTDIYFKTLNKKQTINPGKQTGTDVQGYANQFNGPYSEVQAVQTGILAYAPANAAYSYVLKEETELEIAFKKGSDEVEYKTVKVPAGTLVKVGAKLTNSTENNAKAASISDTDGTLITTQTTAVTVTSAAGTTKGFTNVVYVESLATFDKPLVVEAESFVPETDGLYLFLRTEYKYDGSNAPEFSGYYVDGTSNISTADFYQLNTNTAGNNRSDNTVKGATTAAYHTPIKYILGNENTIIKAEPTANLELFNASYSTVDNANLKWFYDATNQKLYAVKASGSFGTGSDAITFNANTDIVVEINLDNIGTDSAQKWTALGATAISADNAKYALNTSTTLNTEGKDVTFYYNDDVTSGDSTKNLVTSVKLNEQVTNKAYLAFDFDLKVNMDSVQVTFDEDGKEQPTAANSEWKNDKTGTTKLTADATVTYGADSNEINKVTW